METTIPFSEACDLADGPPPYLFDDARYVVQPRLAAELERRGFDVSRPFVVWEDEAAGELVISQD